MEWKDIQSLLSKISGKLQSYTLLQQAVSRAITQSLSITLPEDSVRVRGRTAFVDAHPAVKNEILLKKKEILASIQKEFGERVTDVR